MTCSTAYRDAALHSPRSLHCSSGTISSTARRFSSAALSSPRHRDGKAKHRVILTVCFPEEHVDGSPEEFCSLVPACVQRRRKILLQGRGNHLKCDWHGGDPIRTTRSSGQGVVAHEALYQYVCTGSGNPVYGDEKETKDSNCTAQPTRRVQRRENWTRACFFFARICAFPALLGC